MVCLSELYDIVVLQSQVSDMAQPEEERKVPPDKRSRKIWYRKRGNIGRKRLFHVEQVSFEIILIKVKGLIKSFPSFNLGSPKTLLLTVRVVVWYHCVCGKTALVTDSDVAEVTVGRQDHVRSERSHCLHYTLIVLVLQITVPHLKTSLL
jgi:hypothetical protein